MSEDKKEEIDIERILKGSNDTEKQDLEYLCNFLKATGANKARTSKVINKWNRRNKMQLHDNVIARQIHNTFSREEARNYPYIQDTKKTIVFNSLNLMELEKNYLPYKKHGRGKGKIIPHSLADIILEKEGIKTREEDEKIYIYKKGIYHPEGEKRLEENTQQLLGEDANNHQVHETISAIKRKTYTKAAELQASKRYIHCKNGIYDFETDSFKEFDPEITATTQINAEYDTTADCPEIKEFLKEIAIPNYKENKEAYENGEKEEDPEEEIKIFQEAIGYCLLKGYPIAKAFMLYGDGSNGKTTFLNMLTQFLGSDNVSSKSLHSLCYNKFAAKDLYGKLANVNADIPSSEIKQSSRFKKITGDDKIDAEKKHANELISFWNHAKLFFAANTLPNVKDDTHAFYRRWVPINFPNRFEGEEKDPDKLDKITTEYEKSGLLNWALKGLNRVLRTKTFTVTKETRKVREEWRRESDPTLAFIIDSVELEKEAKTYKDYLYSKYREYCEQGDIQPKIKGQFVKEVNHHYGAPAHINQHTKKEEGKNLKYWRGLRYVGAFMDSERVGEDKQLSFVRKSKGIKKKTKRLGEKEDGGSI